MKHREPSATFTLRLPRALSAQVQHHANVARMSMNTWVLRAIDAALAGEGGGMAVRPAAKSKAAPQ
jgi:predicted HicB family RNase H-like nuclease